MNQLNKDKGPSGKHCYFASLCHVLRKEQPNITEAMTYFIGNGLQLSYKSGFCFEWDTYNSQVLSTLGKVFSIPVNYCFQLQEDQVLEELQEGLQVGGAVVVFIHSKYLDYHPIYANNPNRTHAIILNEIDMKNHNTSISDTLLLDDGGNIHTYEGDYPIERLLGGIWGWAYFEGNMHQDSLGLEELQGLAIARMEVFLEDGLQIDGNYIGLVAYRQYMKHLLLLDSVSDIDFKNVCGKIYYRLRMGSIVTLLEYLYDFVDTYDGYEDVVKERLLQTIHSQHMEWKKTMLNIYKMGIRGKRQMIEPISKKASNLIDEMANVMEEIITLYQEKVNRVKEEMG